MEETLKKKAVIDRIVGKQAILLIDEKSVAVEKRLIPEKSKEGDWLEVEIREGKLIGAKIDQEETSKARERIAEKMARLRRGEHLQK